MPGQFLLLIFPLLMFFAAISDLFSFRISNRLVLGIVAGFVLTALFTRMGWADFGMHVVAALVVLFGAFVLFTFGWVGGGDAKLAGATALWLGFAVTPIFLLYAALLGGALTLLLLGARQVPLPRQIAGVSWISRLHNQGSGIPYGIALAVAGVIAYTHSDIFGSLARLIA